jgi:plastocyanin
MWSPRRRAGRLGGAGSMAAAVVIAALVLAGCGGGGGSSGYKQPTGPAISTVTIEAGNLFFKPKTVTLTPPGIYSLKLVNTASGEHTLVFGSRVPGFRLDVVGDGSTQELKIDLKQGSYTFWCDVPGHRAAGMEGKITVQ